MADFKNSFFKKVRKKSTSKLVTIVYRVKIYLKTKFQKNPNINKKVLAFSKYPPKFKMAAVSTATVGDFHFFSQIPYFFIH